MRAGWKNDPATRAYFEIKRAVQQHNARCNQMHEIQLQALDVVAAELLKTAADAANRSKETRH
ncbi:hypothetical protein [Rhodoferax fermentans]|uniref:Uncharacterized protein n=1 Tax=Rhodoferax fermentans TaxID=28066 RepID=A0A1T1AP48_RHOFE|nr:hypothetical protein [Rhodoferax fermentans]MBK1683450.1 hypothetical protein [Rhodoferax fermentans]OOV05807.1 hypothetical protein RF819_02955 [Rhodoferax fermentans]